MEMEAAVRAAQAAEPDPPARRLAVTVAAAVLPVILVGLLILGFATFGSRLTGPSPVPADALGRLDIERLAFRPDGIIATVVNSGPGELTIAQVLVNDALWHYTVEPGAAIPRLRRAKVTIPYPWLDGEPHTIALITTNGLKFEKKVAIAAATPTLTAASVGTFALLGLYAGGIPVYLGLLWWPFLRRLSQHWMGFLTSLTAGVLLFLGVDVLSEAQEVAGQVPKPYQGTGLVTIGLVIGAGALLVAGRRATRTAGGRDPARGRLVLAYLIATGIGLHNFGEGLAIGAAYILGEAALGALLVVGFTVHNATEGIAIIGPIARDPRRLGHLAMMGGIAGLPTVAGSVIGGLAYSALWATLFLALGAGAIFYVIYELAKLLLRPAERGTQAEMSSVGIFAGLSAGLALMYTTALFVTI